MSAYKKTKKVNMKNGKITILYLFFGMVSVLLVGFLLYYSLSTVMINEAVTSTERSVTQSGKYLEVYIDRLKTMSHLIANNGDVIAYFSHESELTGEQYSLRMNKLIEEVLLSDSSLQSIILISKDGKIFSNEKNLDMAMSADMMKEEWYVKAINSDMPTLTSARMQNFSMNKDLWVISLSQEIVDVNGTNIGVVVLDIPYFSFETYLMDLKLGETGFAFILNEQNQVVFHKDPRYYMDDALRDELVKIKESKSGYQRNGVRLINQYKMANTDWTIVGVSSVDALSIIKRQIIETIAFGSGLIFIGVIVTAIILRQLTTEITKNEKEMHHYEMNALYSQINPHFLYNTLDTIVWMAEFNQSSDVINTTKSLAQFFRLSLNQGKETTSLKDELEHVKQYLYIQKQRYLEKLDYSIESDEDLLDATVPKIIFQPIVENSIYHGIKDLDTNGFISITVRKSVENPLDFVVEIKDNGVGFEQISGVDNVYQEDEPILPKSNKIKLGGVGLKNVHQRIQLFCGNAYGVEIRSELNKGTIVFLKLRRITTIIKSVE